MIRKYTQRGGTGTTASVQGLGWASCAASHDAQGTATGEPQVLLKSSHSTRDLRFKSWQKTIFIYLFFPLFSLWRERPVGTGGVEVAGCLLWMERRSWLW